MLIRLVATVFTRVGIWILYHWKKVPSYAIRTHYRPLNCTLLQVLYHWVVGMSLVESIHNSHTQHMYMYTCTVVYIIETCLHDAHTYSWCWYPLHTLYIQCIYSYPRHPPPSLSPSSVPSLLFPSLPPFLPCICTWCSVTWNTFQKVSMTPQVPWYVSALCISYRGGTMFLMIFFSRELQISVPGWLCTHSVRVHRSLAATLCAAIR